MKILKATASFLGCALFSIQLHASEPITRKNWINHPAIVEVRGIYSAVMKDKTLTVKTKKFNMEYCEPGEDESRAIYRDKNGVIRIYRFSGSFEDTTAQREIVYDEIGTIRFAFIKAGAANGTKIEHRVYFSDAGQKIWEIQEKIKGPGYPFPTKWPEKDLIQNPWQRFNYTDLCAEL